MNPSHDRLHWKAWDHDYLWHPFTQMREWLAEEPLVIERAEGNYLIDSDGKRYFDGVSSLWCNVHGHGRREIVEAIRAQLDAVAHSTMLGLTNVPATVLAKRLIEVAQVTRAERAPPFHRQIIDLHVAGRSPEQA